MKRFNDTIYIVNEQMQPVFILENITIYVDDYVANDMGYVRMNDGNIVPVLRSTASANTIGKWLLRLDVWHAQNQTHN